MPTILAPVSLPSASHVSDTAAMANSAPSQFMAWVTQRERATAKPVADDRLALRPGPFDLEGAEAHLVVDQARDLVDFR